MAKEQGYEKKHKEDLAKIANQIDYLYEVFAKEVASLSVGLESMPADKPFRLSDYPLTEKRLKKIIDKLAKELNICVVHGVRSQWTLANKKNDELCNVVFGKMVNKLTKEQRRWYYTSNKPALDAFLARKVKGLSLSQRVWNYADMSREMIERTLELGVKTGEPATEIARDLKQYLNFPDKLFRRVRDEQGKLHLSKRAAEFHPGPGVYRSSYKNALRLAATETNMAYRSADHLRHAQLDFIVGIEVHLSNNHTCLDSKGVPQPFYDICDELQGKYPKWFDFKGWHPRCRCFTTTILKTPEEVERDSDGIDRGSVNEVKSLPDNWNAWLERNRSRIDKAEARGTLPYFLRDNEWAWKEGVEMPSSNDFKSAQAIAITRHASRTPEQIEDIKRRWNERDIAYNDAEIVLKLADSIPDLEEYWKGEFALGRLQKLRKEYETGKFRSYSTLRDHAQIMLDILEDFREEFKILDHPWEALKKFGPFQCLSARDNILRTMKRYKHLSDREKAEKYRFEARWIEENRKGAFPTWELARDTYLKAAKEMEWKIEWADVKSELDSLALDPVADQTLVEQARALVGKDRAAFDNIISQLKEQIKIDSLISQIESFKGPYKNLMARLYEGENVAGAISSRDVSRLSMIENVAEMLIQQFESQKTDAERFLADDRVSDEAKQELRMALDGQLFGPLSNALQRAQDEVTAYQYRESAKELLANDGALLRAYSSSLVQKLEEVASGHITELVLVETQIRNALSVVDAWVNLVLRLTEHEAYITKSSTFLSLLSKAQDASDDYDMAGLRALLDSLDKEKERLEKEKQYREQVEREFASMNTSLDRIKAQNPTDAELLSLIAEYESAFKVRKLKEARNAYQAVLKEATELGIGYSTGGRETLQELLARLGDKAPKTLIHLQESIDKYESSYRYGDEVKKHKQEIEDTMLDWLSRQDLGMNVNARNLDKILDSWFKNTFETASSNGYLGSAGDLSVEQGGIPEHHSRLSASHEMFIGGRSYDSSHQLKRREYEKYGNLLNPDILASLEDNKADSYGEVLVRFKRSMVIATFTPCDSLHAGYQPTLVTDPKACSFDSCSLGRLPVNFQGSPSFDELFNKCIRSYCELQYHGDLTPDCVESIAFPYDLNDAKYATEKKVALKWKAIGVTIYYRTGNWGNYSLKVL